MVREVVMVILAAKVEAMVWVEGIAMTRMARMVMMVEVMVMVGAVAAAEVPCSSSLP